MNPVTHAARAMLNWSVERKVTLVFFFVIVVFPLTAFVLLQSGGADSATHFLVAAIVVSIILLVPFSRWVSNVVALRFIREIDDQCRLLKAGKYRQVDLPPVRAKEHDFLTLKRNMHWMGHAIASRERKLQAAMAKLADAQRQIGESLDYARLIQTSFLPDEAAISVYLDNHFLVWEQRDVVGGDAYWLKPTDTGFFIGVIDCTGHGVPGAFMTLIVASLLEKAASDGTSSPARILGRMNRLIKDALGQDFTGADDRKARSDDGMDCALCHVPREGGGLVFAGANTPLYVVDRDGARSIKGNRCGLGYVRSDPDFRFSDVTVDAPSGTRVYLLSDGLVDQIGGRSKFPFGRRRFMEFVGDRRHHPLAEQGAELLQTFRKYQGSEARRDDVTVIGFEL